MGLKVTIGVHVGNTTNDKLDDAFSQNTIAEFCIENYVILNLNLLICYSSNVAIILQSLINLILIYIDVFRKKYICIRRKYKYKLE